MLNERLQQWTVLQHSRKTTATALWRTAWIYVFQLASPPHETPRKFYILHFDCFKLFVKPGKESAIFLFFENSIYVYNVFWSHLLSTPSIASLILSTSCSLLLTYWVRFLLPVSEWIYGNPVEHGQPTRPHPWRKRTLSYQFQIASWLVILPLIYARTVADLTPCRSSACNHHYCEPMCVMALSF